MDSSPLQGVQLMSFVFLALLLLFTAVGNILVCIAILKTHRLRTGSNMLIINMAISDIFYSLSTLPLSMVLLCFRSKWPLREIGNIIFDATWFAFLILSFLNVVGIALERYIAITKPFMYKSMITKQYILNACLGCWLYVVIETIALTFSFRKSDGATYQFLIPPVTYYVTMMFHASLAFILVPLFYIKIYSIARKHRLEIIKYQDAKKRRIFKREMKATWTIGLVICLFFLVWLPFLINQFVDFADITNGKWDAKNSAMCYITYCNGPMNIFVYSCWNRDIRNAIIKLFRKSERSSRIGSFINGSRENASFSMHNP